ncbi:metal-sensing transcriptional repressor [Bulleidia sp. zg-1006]|uniref:metal-sensing transcriptional repressor n=1 Tax=Bulleidia sp. zg-1006 TaxID=2806552 RepID=UPI00193A956A|nr:metal-sensing transcriptional repressor [Bulleidia sp. zg-1006]QRG87014.1 metal-sensing transcriptional repressor [Bulleidia sp. zg-1006]
MKCHAHEYKQRSEAEKKALLMRLHRIEGQIRGIEKMVDEDQYCPNIVMQVSAVSSALNSFSKELMASHIQTCVVEDLREGNEESIQELVKMIQKLMK